MSQRMRTLLLACTLLLTACAGKQAPVDDTPSLADIRRQADLAWQYGNYSAAIDGYRAILQTDSTNRDALIGIGNAWLGLGDSAHALIAFEAVLKLEPGAIDALEGRGLARLGSGQHADQASVDFEAVLAIDPLRWRALNGMAMQADLLGQYDAARAWYTRAIAARPEEATLWNNYGWSRVMAHDYVEAEQLLGEALARKSSLRFNANLAVAIAWQGDYERALHTARRTATDYAAYNDIGYIALLRGDTAIAIDYFQEAIDRNPSWFERAATNLERAKQSWAKQKK